MPRSIIVIMRRQRAHYLVTTIHADCEDEDGPPDPTVPDRNISNRLIEQVRRVVTVVTNNQ